MFPPVTRLATKEAYYFALPYATLGPKSNLSFGLGFGLALAILLPLPFHLLAATSKIGLDFFKSYSAVLSMYKSSDRVFTIVFILKFIMNGA